MADVKGSYIAWVVFSALLRIHHENLVFQHGLALGPWPRPPPFCRRGRRTEITGAGASFPAPIYSKWASDYNKATGVKVNYQSIGSGGGIKQIDSKTVDFGASDMPQTDEVLEDQRPDAVPHRDWVAWCRWSTSRALHRVR